eukprot:TRINITY_DN69503_c0_g1_i1.p2 TRINITY_DN69503_c0_g1~~TRINITY_DN69503_c0_g1_i1.p2  ORF type:complete len:112 (+),score=8.82 TRINITY_DN69503_c0_g1_i1:79-414(+)
MAANQEPVHQEAYPQIPDYVVRGRLGRGGAGNVYRAASAQMDNSPSAFAVKVYSGDGRRDAREHFDRETHILRMVQGHPGIVRLHESLFEPLAIVMPRYGRDLYTHVLASS